MIVEPYTARHLEDLLLQPAQVFLAPLLDTSHAQALEATEGYTAIEGGHVIACLGVLRMDASRAIAWGLIGRDAGAAMLAITRAVRRYLDLSDFRRIEAHVEHGFRAAHRWAQMLGFTDETPAGMREFRPGETYHLYARVKHG